MSSQQPDQIQFSDSAAHKVFELIQEEDDYNLKLRVFITGGGCSGFQYGFTFDHQQNDDDIVVENQIEKRDNNTKPFVVKLLIDSMSFQYLSGAEIDYKDDITGSQFIIRNPNAKTTCGCGSSFSIE